MGVAPTLPKDVITFDWTGLEICEACRRVTGVAEVANTVLVCCKGAAEMVIGRANELPVAQRGLVVTAPENPLGTAVSPVANVGAVSRAIIGNGETEGNVVMSTEADGTVSA